MVNVDSLGRSLHYKNINKNIFDRVRFVVKENEYEPVLNISSLGKSIHKTHVFSLTINNKFRQMKEGSHTNM